MFKFRPVRCKLPGKEPDFIFFSHHSAAMLLKKHFVRTLPEQFSLAKTKIKHDLNLRVLQPKQVTRTLCLSSTPGS